MIPVGSKWSLRWRFPHRVEVVVVVALEADFIACDTDHRCGFGCDVGKMLGGEMRYRYDEFPVLFQPMAEDAIALSGGKP